MSKADPEKEFELENKLAEETPAGWQTAKSGVSSETSAGTGPGTASRLNEEPTNEEVAGTVPKQAGAAQGQLGQLKTELDKYKDIALRSVADLDNYRKRMAREKDDAIRYANTSFLERLIPILDNFDLGLQAAKRRSESAVIDGMTMVFWQLQEFHASAGWRPLTQQGTCRCPNLHEAMLRSHAQVEDGFVIRQLRTGYRLKDRLIRPANVVVSKGRPLGEDSAKTGAGT